MAPNGPWLGQTAMQPPNWHQILVPDVSPIEIFVRGTILYWSVLALLRIFKRDPGNVSIADMLFIVLVADASQNGMTGDYKSVTDAVMLVATLAFWNFFLDWLGHHVPAVERILHPPPEPLIVNGKVKHPALRRQLITVSELMSKIRENGVERIEDVKLAQMEGDGTISVVKRKPPKG